MSYLDIVTPFTASKEGLSLVPYQKEYNGHLDVPTIGYGSTHYVYGTAVTMNDAPITQEQALELLSGTLQTYGDFVLSKVTTSLTDNQLAALTDFVYNEGDTHFSTSTLLKCINADIDDQVEITAQFLRWKYVDGVILDGLEIRRKEECNMFFNGSWSI